MLSFDTANQRSVSGLLIVCMAVGFLSLVGAGIAAAWVTQRGQVHTHWVNHTYDVEIAINHASLLIEQAETTRRGFLLTGDSRYLDAYRGYKGKLPAALARIGLLTQDNPRQIANLRQWRPLIDAIVARRDATIALTLAGHRDQAIAAFDAETGVSRMRAIRDQAGAMVAEERRLLAIRDADQQRGIRAFYTVLGVAGVLLLFVAVVSLVTVLRYTRDLAASRATLQELNETLEEQVIERTADLSRANEEIQRFAYIVSHDLRSPLVNVMGFTAELATAAEPLLALVDRVEVQAPDLLTRDARDAVRQDLPEAIGFIRTSTQKMDRLINAILRLSREGRRVIVPEPLDLAAIAEAAVGAMRHVIDERGVAMTIDRPMPPVVSDRLAVEQILSNLIENAIKYLEPGRPGTIAVSATTQRDRVVIAVADNGRGIDPRDHQRIFDLFRRSGRQDQPGEGIGLAHVRALAYRLGGIIDVASRIDEGATFRLNLPMTYQAPQDANR